MGGYPDLDNHLLGGNMTAQNESKTLRPSGKVTLFLAGECLAFLLIGAWRLHAGHSKFDAGVFMLLGSIGGACAVHHLFSKIVLFPDHIEFRGLFRKRSIPKEAIESVTWGAGCGVALRTKEKKWVHLPDVDRAQGVCNSVRAWLKHDKPEA